MKSIGCMILIVLLVFLTVVPADAQDPLYFNPLGALLLFPFAVAATVTTGVAAVLAAPFTYPYASYPAYDPYYPYSYPTTSSYSSPYWSPYTYAAPTYIDAPAPATSYWYYCGSSRTYYPYVTACPEGWMQVVPTGR